MRNPALTATIKSVGEQLGVGSTKQDLSQTFRACDSSNSGACPRDDFINTVFDTVRGVKPAELMKLLQAFSSQYDELVNYEDFLSLVERQGVIAGGGHER